MNINHLTNDPYDYLVEQSQPSGPEIYCNDDDYGDRYEFKPDEGFERNDELKDVPPSDLKALAKAHLGGRKPIPDFDTKNESFIDVFKDLKRLGVKHNKFHLMLYDRELQGVDPFSLTLPVELQIRVQLECIVNPWYWLREVCRIPTDGTPIIIGGGSSFKLDRNNIATWYLFLHGIDHYCSKPRQCGKTQDAIAKFNYAYHFGSVSATILFFNKDSGMARTNLYRLKCQRDMMPKYLQMRMAFGEDGKIIKERDNITTMRNPINGNEIKTQPKATSADSADKLGRGETAALQYYDEFDFEAFNTRIIRASAPAYSTAAENAAKNGSLFCRIFTSTPGDADHRDGISANEFIGKMVKWEERFFDEDINKFKKTVCDSEHNRVVFVEHSWQQLKKTMKWYEKQCGLLDGKPEDILREIGLQRISGSSNSPFSRETLIYLTRNKRQPIESIDISDNYSPIYFYEKINRTYPYIMSIDPAQALLQDRTAMVLINPYTLRVAAEFRSPSTAFPKFLKMIVKFLDEYCPKSMIVVENNRGHELLSMLEETKYRYQVWFNEDSFGKLEPERINKYGVHERAAIMRRYSGFTTDSHTRPMLFKILESMVEDRIDDLYTEFIVEEINSLILKTPTRIEHAPGKHDDVLFAYLIGLCVYFNASNLEDYGIKRGMKEPTITGNEDPQVLTQKMVGLMSKLPDDYKAMFLKAIDKDPVAESEKYASQVQNASRQKRRDLGINSGDTPDNPFNDPDGDAWKQLDEQIWKSNDFGRRDNVASPVNDPLSDYDMFNNYGLGSQGWGFGGPTSGSSELDDFFNNL